MKKNLWMIQIILLVAVGLVFASCSKTAEAPAAEGNNPFFAEYDTPYQVPPFHIITPAHFIPAYEKVLVFGRSARS